jgi:nucleoid-associated protein YgaU
MSRFLAVMLLLAMVVVAGCASAVSRWRDDAWSAIGSARDKGAAKEFPAEYASVLNVLQDGDKLLQEKEVAAADDYFRFALTKCELLERELGELKSRRTEEARLRSLSEKRENERLRALREQERKAAEVAEAKKNGATPDKARGKEKPLPSSHTVKRGETLPQIASQPDVYNDYRLWPLLYRANRDQISDPKHIWPGQVLRIPRNQTREEMNEARRYSLSKPIR